MHQWSRPGLQGGQVSDSVHAPKLFISYRRKETPVSAAWLYEVLVERFGEPNVFMDLKFKPGENFVKRTSEVVGACHILLVVMGLHWAAPEGGDGPASIKDPNDFVRLETEIAMERNDVSVLPVLVGGATMPHPDELPDKIRGLTDIQAKQLTNERRAEDMKELVGRVEELLPPETVVHRVPRPTGPSRPAKKREPKDERRPRWQIAVAAVAAVAVAAVVLVATGALSGGGESDDSGPSAEATYPIDRKVDDLDARGDMVVLRQKEEASTSVLAQLDLTERKVDDLGLEPAKYNGMDVGTDAQGHEVVVASRCRVEDCDVHRLRGNELDPLRLSQDTCQAVRPSIDAGRVLFSLQGGACETRGLYLTNGSAKNPQAISRVGTRGADLNGRVAAALLLDRRTLGLLDTSDAGEDLYRIEAVKGHTLFPPVVVDDPYVYFVDRVGSSYWVARIDPSEDPLKLERYVPADGPGPAQSAPRFGVTSGRLYVSGLPQPDGTAGSRVIVRDDDPEFDPVEGAVEGQ
jgi:TIR domain